MNLDELLEALNAIRDQHGGDLVVVQERQDGSCYDVIGIQLGTVLSECQYVWANHDDDPQHTPIECVLLLAEDC